MNNGEEDPKKRKTSPESRIEYYVKAILCTKSEPIQQFLESSRSKFYVLENVSPNLLWEPAPEQFASKSFLFSGRDLLVLRVKLDQYVNFIQRGVPLTVDIENTSRKTVQEIVVNILRIVTYKTVTSSLVREFVELNWTVPNTSVRAGEHKVFALVPRIRNPALPGTIELSSIFQNRFEIHVNAIVSKGFNLQVSFPVHFLIQSNKKEQIHQCIDDPISVSTSESSSLNDHLRLDPPIVVVNDENEKIIENNDNNKVSSDLLPADDVTLKLKVNENDENHDNDLERTNSQLSICSSSGEITAEYIQLNY